MMRRKRTFKLYQHVVSKITVANLFAQKPSENDETTRNIIGDI